MRRTALAVTAAAATLVAVPLLSSCSSTPRPGAAAVLDGERITVSQLQSQVEDVRAAQRDSAQAEELINQSGNLTIDTLNSMLQGRVIERAAEDHGVRVRSGQVQQARAAEAQQAGGEKQLEAAYLQQYGIAPDELDQWYERQLMLQGVVQQLGVNPQTQQGQVALTETMTAASKQLEIDVSPRYGAWDDRQIQLTKSKTPWLKQVTAGAKEPAAAAQP